MFRTAILLAYPVTGSAHGRRCRTLMGPYEALRIIEVLVRVVKEADNPDAPAMFLREIRGVLAKAVPRKPRRKRRKA